MKCRVTIKKLGKKHPHHKQLYEARLNGKGMYFPATLKTARRQARDLKASCKK